MFLFTYLISFLCMKTHFLCIDFPSGNIVNCFIKKHIFVLCIHKRLKYSRAYNIEHYCNYTELHVSYKNSDVFRRNTTESDKTKFFFLNEINL